MHSIQHSFPKKRVLQYDHYNRYDGPSSFEPRNGSSSSSNNGLAHIDPYPTPKSAGPSYGIGRRPPLMPSSETTSLSPPPPLTNDPTFDILDWHPAYQSCQRFFLDHAQHEPATQALCALINVRLPFQYFNNPIADSTSTAYSFNFPRPGGSPPSRSRSSPDRGPSAFVSLIPYVRRLVVTGFDKPAILHGMFGDDYKRGILPHLDCERRNYLFAAKHEGWGCKRQYDSGSGMGGDESVPFMKPLDEAKVAELTAAEKAWSGWLAMEDWMVGPRAPKEEPEKDDNSHGDRAAPTTQRQSSGRAPPVNHADNLPDGVPEAFARTHSRPNGTADHVNGDVGEGGAVANE